MERRRAWAVWITWFAAVWLLAMFIASIVSYTRGIDVVALVIALIAELTLAIAWSIYRPLPLWMVYFLGLILWSAVVGLWITVPGGPTVSWLELGILPAGVATLVAAFIATDRSTALTH